MGHQPQFWTRRRLIGSACALAASALRAETPAAYSVFPEYARCLPDYLTGLAADAYARRNARIAALRTPAAVREYQAWARRTFRQLAGALPERTALNLRTTGSFERDRYRVENVIYESRPGLFVTANLYLPKSGSGPFPGVLFQMGHTPDGKGSGLYQACCQGLVQLGYVVLAFDPYGQGERTGYPRPGGWLSRIGADAEHSVPGKQLLLVGETATGAQLWDGVRGLDVLAAHPHVDAKRLATTGQSGGGTTSMILAAMDERVAAAAVSSGNTENFATVPFHSPGSTDDAEQDLVGSAPLAFDRWDMLWPMAPKPLLVAASGHDFFGTYSPSYEHSGREQWLKLEQGYEILGAHGKLGYFESPLPHGLSYPMRLAVYNWFEKHLKGSDRTLAEEPPIHAEDEQTLWCGKTGNTVRDFGGKTIFSLASERAHAIQTPDRPRDLRALLGMDPPAAPAPLEVRGKTAYRKCDVQAVEVNSAKKVLVPGWLFLPKSSWTRLLVLVEPTGRNVLWREDGLYDQLASAGTAVCAADVRGVGDLEPQFSAGAAHYERPHQQEEDYAWGSLILGRSLLGQRTTDIAALARALGQAYPRAEIVLAARDRLTVPALCAAALEPRIAKTYLSHHLVSWRSVAETENYSTPLASLVPNALAAADLPEIARSIAPRPVIVAGAIDAAGHALSGSAPYANYRPQPAWDFETLANL